MNNDNNENDENDENEKQEQETLIPLTLSNTKGMTQLQIDAINVFENRVDINSFPKEYQIQIKNFYRFSPIDSNNGSVEGGRSFWK